MSSDDFCSETLQLCKNYLSITQENCYKILTTIVFLRQRNVIEHVDNRSDKEIVGNLKKIPKAENLSGPARGKIRYIGGFVIAKLKCRNSRAIRSSLFAKGKDDVAKIAQHKAKLFDSLSSTYNDLVTVTNDPESLQETPRKQYISESLCNINDDAVNFFIQTEKYSRDLMTYENLQMKKSDLFIYVK
jgi:hypothetical protein